LVFSSKGKSLYTQMFLTHIDEAGQDSPAILIENATAANRAVNIPEFANVGPDGLAKMEAPATDFYRVLDVAGELARKGNYEAALPEWRKAVDLDPADARARYHLAFALDKLGQPENAVEQYRKSVELDPNGESATSSLAATLLRLGNFDQAISWSRKALELNPKNALTEGNLAAALLQTGQTDSAVEHIRRALELDPEFADAHNMLGIVLARGGRLDEGIAQLRLAVISAPESPEYRFNLGRLLAARHTFPEAIPEFEKAVALTGGKEVQSLEMLAAMYSEVGRFADAAATARQALSEALSEHNNELVRVLSARIGYYDAEAAKR
jgi:Flp pilus assembly protein TadD